MENNNNNETVIKDNGNNGAIDNQGQGSEKTYTQEEVDKLLQSEADRRVSEALKKVEKKNQEKVKEAEKLAKMNADEKYAYELEQREKAIEAKEKELSMAENKNAASAILAEKGISLKLVDFVVDADAEIMNDRIKLLDAEFKKSVKEEVEKRLAGSNPKKSLPMDGSITKEQFNKMSLREQSKLAIEQPELYNSLTK